MIRRGTWITKPVDHPPIVRTSNSGARPINTDTTQSLITGVSGKGAGLKQLSEFRRDMFSDKSVDSDSESVSPVLIYSPSYKANKKMKDDFLKTAAVSGVGSTFGQASSSSTVRQSPEVYSPLFQMANLQLPRDRITMNAWNRNFYDTHPLVHNCINLHATYPISKINIKCKDAKIEQFFNEMVEDLDLMSVLQSIALELWKLGEQVCGNTGVFLADGTTKQIKDIQIGDMVLTHLGNKKRVIDRFIKPTHRVGENVRIYKVSIVGFPEPLIISGNHPVFTLLQSQTACDTPSCVKRHMRIWPNQNSCSNCGKTGTKETIPDFVAIKDIKENDLVCGPFNTEINEDPRFTPELCYLMGFWLAEGCYVRNHQNEYSGIKLTQYDRAFLANKIGPLFESVFGMSGSLYGSNKPYMSFGKNAGNVGRKYVYHFEGKCRKGHELSKLFLEHCGEHSKTKKLSNTIMSLPVSLQKQLLAGFIDGDGCVDQSNGHIIIATASYNLANQIVLMLRRCSMRPTMSRVYRLVGSTPTTLYRIKIVANEAHSNFFGLLKSNKNDRLRKTKWATKRTALQKNWQLLPIKTIEDITDQFTDEYMYDIEVEDDHSYVANGIAIHNCFPYAQLDEKTGRWGRIDLQNPDYVHVKKSPVGGSVSLSLRPDPALLHLIQSSNPDDRRLVDQMDPEMVYHVRKGNSIPLDNFHASHLKMLSSAYDMHGTSILVSIYKDLMLYDKLRECYSEDTEVLTNQGFRRYDEVIEVIDGVPKAKTEVKIACLNPAKDQIEYHTPTNAHLSDFTGKMRHFNGKKVDVLVTQNHRMWESRKLNNGWSDWGFKQAQELSRGTRYRFRSVANWVGENKETIEVCGKPVPIELYLRVLGYILSEGCVHSSKYVHNKNGKEYEHFSVSLSQKVGSDCFDDIQESFMELSRLINKHVCRCMGKDEVCDWSITGKDIVNHFKSEIGVNGSCLSKDKHIPRWVLSLNKHLLEILLHSLIRGDGTEQQNKMGTGFKYFTVSNALANDVQELAFKCGFASNKYKSKNGAGKEYWVVSWTDNSRGRFPNIYGNSKRGVRIDDVDYSGKVWCFEVPTGLFITRRNGKITVQGNSKFAQADNLVNPITIIKVGGTAEGEFHPTSVDLENYRQTFEAAQYDKDFKIITHAGVTVERVGASGQIIDIAPDMAFILDNICFGLMVPKNILIQEGAAFASASIGLEVLKQRYESFRNMMSQWLIRKIFAPISEIQEFYNFKDGEKKLIVPEIDWNHMALYDMDNYIGVIKELANNPQNPVVSKATLFRSLGLNEEEERRRIKAEAIQTVILQKELAILQNMSLGALRSLKDGESDIIEGTEAPLPGTPGTMPEESGMPGGLPGLGGPETAGGGLGELGLPTPPTAGGAGLTPPPTTPPPSIATPPTPSPAPKV